MSWDEQYHKDAKLGAMVRELPRGARLCRHKEENGDHLEWWVAIDNKLPTPSCPTPEEAIKYFRADV